MKKLYRFGAITFAVFAGLVAWCRCAFGRHRRCYWRIFRACCQARRQWRTFEN